jgi:hypothetical protein
VREPVLGDLEAGLQVEDGLAVLDGDDAPRGERPAVADAVDLVEDGHGGVARAQEVRVQRVHHPPQLDRPRRRHEGLARHLPTEHALAVLVRRETPEDVDLDGLEVEQAAQGVDGLLGHGAILA